MSYSGAIFVSVFVAVVSSFLAVGELVHYSQKKKNIRKLLKKSETREERESSRKSILLLVGNWYDGTSLGREQESKLRASNIGLRPSEFLGIRVLVFAALAWLLANFFNLGIPFNLVLAYLAVTFGINKWMHLRQEKQVEKLNEQLPEVCRQLGSSIKAGLSIQQGMSLLAQDLKAPAGPAFRLAANEIKLGTALDATLKEMVDNYPSQELELLYTTIIIQKQAGGNLGQVLDQMAETLEKRERVNQELSEATAESRFTAMILPVLPLFIFIILNSVFPGFLSPLFTPPGLVLLVIVIGMLLFGFLIIRKLTSIKV